MTPQQRRAQIGRIHAAKAALALPDAEYRQLLASLTGLESCSQMDDRDINHVLDWLNWLSGRRPRQPISFARRGVDPHANLVRLCYAVTAIVPPGYEVSPLRSMAWQERTCGRCAAFYEELTSDELTKLLEGLKGIFRRLGCRGPGTLDNEPLEASQASGPAGTFALLPPSDAVRPRRRA